MDYKNIATLVKKVFNFKDKTMLPYILLAIYLVCLYFAYKVAQEIENED